MGWRIAAIALLALAGRAAADATLPGRAGESWTERCAQRIEAARVELIANVPELVETGVRVDENGRIDLEALHHSVVVMASTDGDRAWTHDPLESRYVRISGGHMGWINARNRRPEPFVTRMKQAIDGCFDEGTARRYRLEGQVISDSCGGQVRLAARNIMISQNNQRLSADVVERSYQARIKDGRLIAEGYFPVSGERACKGSTLFERWTLVPDGPDALVGELSSSWPLQPSCDRPCEVKFRLRATRTSEAR